MVGRFLHTDCTPAEWQWTGRRRILVESQEAWAWAPALEAAGYEVAICGGPRPGERCPLLAHGTCATASGAHVVVSSLPSDIGPSVVAALREHYPHAEVVDARRSPDELLASLDGLGLPG